ncbi:MAG: DUF2239 family protein [Granulosicoccaceae bacterium]
MNYLAIHQQKLLICGELREVIAYVKSIKDDIEPIVVERDSCRRIEIDWHGDLEQVLLQLPAELDGQPQPVKRGRPKLGVVSKEVTLLPRHWDWLANQRGGASVTLRRLVEMAQRNATVEDRITLKQQQLDKFMLLFLGDSPGFEEAGRALYRNSRVGFVAAIADWPDEIQDFVLEKFTEISRLHEGEAA